VPAIKQWTSYQRGLAGEQRAKRFLQAQHLLFVEQNYKCKGGEIDLIFRDQQLWVFIEVKYRENTHHGRALEYFTPLKHRRMLRSIECYFAYLGLNINSQDIRIDVVAIDGEALEWVRGVS